MSPLDLLLYALAPLPALVVVAVLVNAVSRDLLDHRRAIRQADERGTSPQEFLAAEKMRRRERASVAGGVGPGPRRLR